MAAPLGPGVTPWPGAEVPRGSHLCRLTRARSILCHPLPSPEGPGSGCALLERLPLLLANSAQAQLPKSLPPFKAMPSARPPGTHC